MAPFRHLLEEENDPPFCVKVKLGPFSTALEIFV